MDTSLPCASLVAAMLIFVMLAVGVWLVVRWSLRPVAGVQKAIRERNPLDLTPLPGAYLPDEIRPLVGSFNRLLGQLDSAMQAERRFIADAAHELRTPLAALSAHAQLALAADDIRAEKAALRRLVAVAERSARLSEQLLDLARLDARKSVDGQEWLDLHELVVVMTRDFEAVASRKRQSISLDTEPCVIAGDTDEFGILIGNLIDNALRYTGEGGRIAVSCLHTQVNGRREVCLRVADNGPGVPEAERQRIFDRFYRVAGNGERGSGIGLSLVARIAQSHAATLEVGPGLDGRGLGVAVWFTEPRVDHRLGSSG